MKQRMLGALRHVWAAITAALRAAPGMLVETAALAGVAAIAVGCWLIYVPAGWIAGGVLLVALSILWRIGLQRRG